VSFRLSLSLKQIAPLSACDLLSHALVSCRDDGVEDRYSVLVEFEDQKSADGFYLDLNGWRFSSSEVANIVNWISVLFADHVQDRC